MASGPHHFHEAELLLIRADDESDEDTEMAAVTAGMAQVNATLALAAATAFSSDAMPKADWDAWRQAAATTAPVPGDSGDGPWCGHEASCPNGPGPHRQDESCWDVARARSPETPS